LTAIEFFFYLFAFLAVVSALGMILNVRNTVAAAMSLVVTMISLGGIFVLLDAYLIAALQILVYAGAIVVLFLFVVMLLNLRQDTFSPARRRGAKVAGAALAVGATLAFLAAISTALPAPRELPAGFGGYAEVGRALYGDYALTFDVAAFLILGAVVGAVVLAKRRLD
jgi:NADH-quinone oxidoreductase subunit J